MDRTSAGSPHYQVKGCCLLVVVCVRVEAGAGGGMDNTSAGSPQYRRTSLLYRKLQPNLTNYRHPPPAAGPAQEAERGAGAGQPVRRLAVGRHLAVAGWSNGGCCLSAAVARRL